MTDKKEKKVINDNLWKMEAEEYFATPYFDQVELRKTLYHHIQEKKRHLRYFLEKDYHRLKEEHERKYSYEAMGFFPTDRDEIDKLISEAYYKEGNEVVEGIKYELDETKSEWPEEAFDEDDDFFIAIDRDGDDLRRFNDLTLFTQDNLGKTFDEIMYMIGDGPDILDQAIANSKVFKKIVVDEGTKWASFEIGNNAGFAHKDVSFAELPLNGQNVDEYIKQEDPVHILNLIGSNSSVCVEGLLSDNYLVRKIWQLSDCPELFEEILQDDHNSRVYTEELADYVYEQYTNLRSKLGLYSFYPESGLEFNFMYKTKFIIDYLTKIKREDVDLKDVFDQVLDIYRNLDSDSSHRDDLLLDLNLLKEFTI